MDVLTGQVVPLLLFGGVCAVGYAYATGSFSKKRNKVVKRTVEASGDETAIIVPEKKKKAPKVVVAKPKKSKVKQRVEIFDLSDDESSEEEGDAAKPEVEVVEPPQPTKKASAKTKEVAKTAPVEKKVAPTPAPAPVEAPKPVLSQRDAEIELLKQKIRDLEAQQNKPAPAPASSAAKTTAAPAEDKKARQGKAKKQQEETTEYNPPPSLTPEQRAEQQRLFALYDNTWKTVEAPTKKKSKVSLDYEKLLENAPVLSTVSDVTVDNEQRRLLIGRKGQTLHQLCEQTGCTVEVPQELRANPATGVREEDVVRAKYKVLLQGTPQQISDARAIINELLAHGYSHTLFPNIDEARLRVNKSFHKLIVLERAKIAKVTRVQIDIPAAAEEDEVIHLKGEKEQVEVAKAAIRSLVVDGFSELTHPGWTKVVVDFPVKYRFVLLRQKGQLVQTVQRTHGCKIFFPPTQDKDEVKVVGPQDRVELAVNDINRIIQKVEEPVHNIFAKGFDSYDFSLNDQW